MNMISFAASNPLENPLVLLAILLLSALANWIMKGRQAAQDDNWPDGEEPPPAPGQEGRSERDREREIQEALRRFMRGEPPLRAPSPPPVPVPSVDRDEPEAQLWADEEEALSPERDWLHEAPSAPAAIPREVKEAVESRLHHAASALSSRRYGQVAPPLNLPPPVAGLHDRRRPRKRAAAVALVRDPRMVRHAFVASLVFGPPKAFDAGQL